MRCPHCSIAFHDKWQAFALRETDGSWRDVVIDPDGNWRIDHTVCPACGKVTIRLTDTLERGSRPKGWLVYPKGVTRAPVAPEVPEECAATYKEACLVLPDSEKASAALSRRCLQHLLREKAGAKKKDLLDQIQEILDSKQLPSHLAEALDAVRVVGNFAAHPIKSQNTGAVLDVEPGEAEWLLEVLEGLFDFYFVQPARTQAKREALNKKLQEAGKPPLR